MAASKTDIANKALTLVGANPITSLDDSAQNARILNRVYDISLRSILSECRWNFATKRTLLALSADTLAWYNTQDGLTITYARPSDVVRIFSTNDRKAVWQEEQDYIISDTSDLGIKYVFYLDNPAKYPSFFTDAFIDKLCSDIAFMILNSGTVARSYLEKYEGVSLPRAMSQNSQIGEQQQMRDDEWTNAKYNNSQASDRTGT